LGIDRGCNRLTHHPISSAPRRQQPSAITVAPSQAELDKEHAERVAKARAEQEQQAKQKAALEEARLATRADPASEAKAQSEREQSARRQAAVDDAHRAAAEAEDAWKRFYKPSANCKNPDARATVECVGEYIKANASSSRADLPVRPWPGADPHRAERASRREARPAQRLGLIRFERRQHRCRFQHG
jgi:hypothetical protein